MLLGNKGDKEHCFKCSSSYKVTLIERTDIWSCQGLCRKQYNNCRASVNTPAEVVAAPTAEVVAAPTSQPVDKDAAAAMVCNEVNPMEETAEESPWKIGDYCRAQFTADSAIYEGILQTKDKTEEGTAYGTVKFLGYGNEETVWLESLLPSEGDDARNKQIKAAEGKPEEPQVAVPAAEMTPKWNVGDRYRVYYQDQECEATLESIDADENGTYYGQVRFAGGDTTVVWCDDLMPTKGEEAAAVSGTGVATEEAAVEQSRQEEPVVVTTSLKEEKRSLTDQMVQADSVQDTIATMKEENKALKKRLDDQVAEATAIKDVEEMGLQNVKKWTDKYATLESEFKKSNDKSATLERELKKSTDKYATLDKEFEKLSSICTAAQASTAQLIQQLNEQKRQLDEKEAELAAAANRRSEPGQMNGTTTTSQVALVQPGIFGSSLSPFVIFPQSVNSSGDGAASTSGDVLNAWANVPNCQMWYIHPLPRACESPTCGKTSTRAPPSTEATGNTGRFIPLRPPHRPPMSSAPKNAE